MYLEDSKHLTRLNIFKNSNIADDVTALYMTCNDYYGNPKSRKPNPKLDLDFLGPQTMLHDFWRGQGWDIVTHSGFLTYNHHDVSGFLTYVYPRSGSKIWGIIRIRNERIPKDRSDLFMEYDNILDEKREGFHESCVTKTILLEEGDVLYDNSSKHHSVH